MMKQISIKIRTNGRGTYEITGVRSVLTQTGLDLPVNDGQLDLGTWQGVFVWEHRHAPHSRRLTLTVHGE